MRSNGLLWLALGSAALLFFATKTETGRTVTRTLLPRGIRNNNPGNIIRSGIRWRGMAPEQTDPKFVVFVSPEWGIRAMARLLRSYINSGHNTIRRIITRWAPPTENPTDAYIAAVARETGLHADSPVTVEDFPRLIAAIIRFENGEQPYSPEVIAEGIRLEQTA